MSRRDQFLKAASERLGTKQPKLEQKKPEIMCGLCKHYLEMAFSGEGVGSCELLKIGSDILADPPVFDLESKNGYRTMNLQDASRCSYYEKMDFVDKDGTECIDPRFSRTMRQMQD